MEPLLPEFVRSGLYYFDFNFVLDNGHITVWSDLDLDGLWPLRLEFNLCLVECTLELFRIFFRHDPDLSILAIPHKKTPPFLIVGGAILGPIPYSGSIRIFMIIGIVT